MTFDSIYWDCALPINFILEKVYVFLWGWFVFIFVLNVYSLFVWIYKLFVPGKRNHFVKKFLRLLDAHDYRNKDARHAFIGKMFNSLLCCLVWFFLFMF